MITYSTTILYYNIYLTYAVPYLIANATRLGLSTDQVTLLGTLLDPWDTAMRNYLNPQTHGALSVATINGLYATYLETTNAIKQQLKNNAGITLNETDYLVIDIHKDSTRRKNIPKPSAEAMITMEASRHLYNQYRVADVTNPTKKGKPKDVLRIKIKMVVKNADAPAPTLSEMPQIDDITVITFDIPFTEDQVGKIAYLAVCFSNDSGDGPYSEIIQNPII